MKEMKTKIKLDNLGSMYKKQVISGLYCVKKIKEGYRLDFIRKIMGLIEGRLMYIKHKLKSNMFHMLKQN